MIRILGTIFAGLLGLAFGSFLNVCLSRWPQGESIVHPRSHCRNCDHTLSWWENIPLISWLALRGRCRKCKTPISWRYPLVELAVGILWTLAIIEFFENIAEGGEWSAFLFSYSVIALISQYAFFWLLVALAIFDAEHLWLPNFLTLPGIALGLSAFLLPQAIQKYSGDFYPQYPGLLNTAIGRIIDTLAAALLILLIRLLYKLIRHREGIGLGDAKLMALLAAWLGLPGALLAFFIGVLFGALVGAFLLIKPSNKSNPKEWSATKLPLGTFLCIGGIVSALWGQPLITTYLQWAGF